MLSLVETLRDIDAGRLTAAAALAQSQELIVAKDAELGAFVSVDPKPRVGNGPWRGIAVAVKDLIDTADFATAYGSPVYAGWRPKADAAIVCAIKSLGGTVIGKTVTTPFAFLDPAGTCNPHNRAHTPGGSSSGSAAAVAAGLVPLAIGTQTGGSVIRPASFCGVAAIKPSFGLLPMVGIKPFAWSLDTLGLFGARVGDIAHGLAALSGRGDLANIDGAVPCIGIVTQDFAGAPEPSGGEALANARRAAERAGARVRDLAMPDSIARAWTLHPVLQGYEATRALAWEYANHYAELPTRLRGELDARRTTTPESYDEARATAKRARADLNAVFAEVDIIITYSSTGAAPSLASTGDPRFNRVWTLMGTPCVNVTAHRTEGLPVGVQVIARYGDDARALAAAAFLERALG